MNESLTAAGSTEELIELLRTLADPVRLRVLRLLEMQRPNGNGGHGAGASGGGGGLSVGELGDVLKLPQSTVSRHLKTLTDAQLTDVRREGTSMFYRLAERPGSPPPGSPAPAIHAAARQLRALARTHLEHDPAARNDAQRLAAVLRRRAVEHRGAEAFFGKHAPRWDELRAQWFGDTFHLEGLLALMNPGWTIADIGAGTGAMLPLLSPHVAKVIAVDSSPAMLKAARARVKDLRLRNVELHQGSLGEGAALPMAERSVDVALLALVLVYAADPAGALVEVRRILRQSAGGGIVLLIDLQPHAVEMFRKQLHHRWMGFSQEELGRWLTAAGFVRMRWHPLAAQAGRSKKGEASRAIPDLFAMRAEVGHG